ncbi:MAG: ECF subfamily [Verrucomicrobia bacterium]|nr:MAG: ECF subfamily [Verrucomicrobiota bacterium]
MNSHSPDYQWFIEQVRLEQAGLRVFVRTLGLRAEAADDVAQEAFVVAFEKLQIFERGTNFGAWVRTIARFLVGKELRREDRRQRLLAEHVAEILSAENIPAPDDTTAKAEALKLCLRELPERWRTLVQQRYFENLAPSVIASHEGRSANEIRQALFRLRSALHDCITRRITRQTI